MKSSTAVHVGLHSLVYDLAWLCCILSATATHPWLGPLITLMMVGLMIGWQIKRDTTKHMLTFMGLFWLAGFIGDALLMHGSILTFPDNANFLGIAPWVPPIFMQTLWLSFGLFCFAVFRFLKNHLLISALLAAAGFPIAYGLGALLGAATYQHLFSGLVYTSMIYTVLVPVVFYVYKRVSYDEH